MKNVETKIVNIILTFILIYVRIIKLLVNILIFTGKNREGIEMNKVFFLIVCVFLILVGLIISDDYQNIMNGNQGEIEEVIKEPEKIEKEEPFFSKTEYKPANHELQYYLPSQVAIYDNEIKMIADIVDDHYVSGKVESQLAFRYGTFTFKINSINGNGLFPAIWLLPSNNESYPEVDIYELIGNNPNEFYGVLHYVEEKEKKRDFFTYDFSSNIPKEYVIKFEWSADYMIWYLNNEIIYVIESNVPNVPMYLIFNLAIGGTWPGNPDSKTVFPTTFNVEILEFNPLETYTR